MPARLRTLLAQVGSFVLAGVLLYLALRGVDFSVVGQALREADYRWLLPLAAIVMLSHLLRAWRWQMLLEALPPDDAGGAPRRVSLKIAFYSVMLGYMVNYAAPRLGEVARAANMASREKMRFSSVLGTVVVERILDVIVLALALGSVFFLFADRFGMLHDLFIAPVGEWFGHIPAMVLGVIAIAVVVLMALVYVQALRREDSAVRRLWHRKLKPVLSAFKDGLLTVLRSPKRLLLVVSTVAMWACYLIMAHVPFIMLGMTDAYHLSLLDSWGIMNLGALGVVVPSPGGTGSYHYVTIQTLVHLFSIPEAPAATYAVLTHGAQMVLYTAVGALCLMLQGSSFRSLKEATLTAQSADASMPELTNGKGKEGPSEPTVEIDHGAAHR